jgi:hypothetical protein
MKPIKYDGTYISTHAIPIIIARAINKIGSENRFDIHWLALVYVVILIIVFSYIFTLLKRKIFISLLAILFFTDSTIIAYFNSFFGEPVAYIFFLLGIVAFFTFCIKGLQDYKYLIVFLLSMVMLVGAKLQYNILCIPIALFCIRIIWVKKEILLRGIIILGIVLILLTSFTMNNISAKNLNKTTNYDSVFNGILKDSSQPKKDLEELGIKNEYYVLANTTVFTNNLPIDITSKEFENEFYNKISNYKIAIFYLKHPIRLLTKMEITAKQSMSNDKTYLGNYSKDSGYEQRTFVTRFKLWSNIKNALLPRTLFFMIPFSLVFITVCIYKRIKAKNLKEQLVTEFLLLIISFGIIQFPMPLMGNGDTDVAKQLFFFNTVYDITIFISVVYIVNLCTKIFHRKDSNFHDIISQ